MVTLTLDELRKAWSNYIIYSVIKKKKEREKKILGLRDLTTKYDEICLLNMPARCLPT